MSSSFLQMKKSRDVASQKLLKTINDMSKGGGNNQKDERFWYPERDTNGNGFAIIRFLPESKDNDTPVVRVFSHGFKSPKTGKWYIENCPTTIGENCPCCEANSEMWNKGDEDSKNVARSRKRKVHFIANVLIVQDKATPENEGKVKLFQFGSRIFDMISSAAAPEFEDEKPINAFDPWEGANFKLKIIKKDGNTNYDKSEFEEPSKIGTDKEIEEIWEQQVDLREFVGADKFLPYEELQKRFFRTEGVGAPTATQQPKPEAETGVRSLRKVAESKPLPERETSVEVEDDDVPFETGADDDDPIRMFEEAAKRAIG